ncbi:MAG TPA: hypothetical protein VF980_07820 [Thermoanaerobaculia bacterium]
MKTKHGTAEETRIAHEIVSVLPEGSVTRVCGDDRETVRFRVNGGEMKLRSIVLRRDSLHRLDSDPARAIKIEYLQREILESATHRAEFRYPPVSALAKKTPRSIRLRAAALAVAAVLVR